MQRSKNEHKNIKKQTRFVKTSGVKDLYYTYIKENSDIDTTEIRKKRNNKGEMYLNNSQKVV